MNQETQQIEKVKLNDIFETSWGYDQTNVDFIKVVEISPSGKTVKAVKIGQKMAEQNFLENGSSAMSEKVVPDPETVTSGVFRMKVAEYQGKEELRGSYIFCQESKRFDYFRKWDGKPCYQSHYA